ncbi:biotin-independent malonate decarboxylase subunit gamma [Francisella sp. SYW-9]|uniref:biotin-independent malonate decarboxylase subunit gamma n=1 Tax=Francisella sp. SYW-9 TaxID=2610888 RepID=UPI00123D1D1B|nr:biotin-independent malonate decarboxylase subunit gamma [Francisella sp. SYW-9]
MKTNDFLNSVFAEGCSYDTTDGVVFGQAILDGKPVKILGVENDTFLGVKQALLMAEKVVETIEEGKQTPIFMPVDVAGQKLAMQDEWLSMNQYFAHLLEALEVARNSGHTLISAVYNQAIGGGFIAFGLMCDQIYALPEAKVAVMWLEGMAKVTKISQSRLEELSKTSAVFAPGIENFKNLGGIHKVLNIEEIPENLKKDLYLDYEGDERAKLGFERGGRKWALPVMEQILNS